LRKVIVAVAFALALAAPAPALAAPAPALAAAPSTSHSCYGVHGRLVCGGYSMRPVWRYECAFVSRQALEGYGWGLILNGAGFSIWGLFADGTIVGLPAGAVLGAIGIGSGASGSFIVWYADTYYQPRTVCAWVKEYVR